MENYINFTNFIFNILSTITVYNFLIGFSFGAFGMYYLLNKFARNVNRGLSIKD